MIRTIAYNDFHSPISFILSPARPFNTKSERVRPAEWFSPRRDNAVPSYEAAPRDVNEALVALNAAIRTWKQGPSNGEALRALVLAYTDCARDENLSPEQMLIRLKHALDDALVSADDDPTRRNATRARVVELAIDSYYSDRR